MSLKPLDMQVMIPKTQEIAQLNHLRQQQGHLNQNQIHHTMSQTVQKEIKNVNKPNEKEQAFSKFDAKEEGKNAYHQTPHQKKKKEMPKKKTLKTNRIDIRI